MKLNYKTAVLTFTAEEGDKLIEALHILEDAIGVLEPFEEDIDNYVIEEPAGGETFPVRTLYEARDMIDTMLNDYISDDQTIDLLVQRVNKS